VLKGVYPSRPQCRAGHCVMIYSKQELWQRFKKYYIEFPTLDLALDLSRMNVSEEFFADMGSRIQEAFASMMALEGGAIANPDEGRMVGHYWLRNPALAPNPSIRKEIEDTIVGIKSFAAEVHSGVVRGANGTFTNMLIIGIGGSALGPQFVARALGHPNRDKVRPFFFDNTDPDGMERVISDIGSGLGRTLCIVISKSGGTKETRNGMLEAKSAYERGGYDFGSHTIAITKTGSELFNYAKENSWLKTFPMWDWVGGRTSELSAAGLLPAALQGVEIESIIAGARASDEVTRRTDFRQNPSALLALAWHDATGGVGAKNMVVIPYRDRLELLSRYLQQLVMESLGKRFDTSGMVVNQGISVFGNKGSTDQHSYIQQLRDGLDDFFVTFIEVLSDQDSVPIFVEDGFTSGDYLHGFFLGTRQALAEDGRLSVTITIGKVSPFSVGVLIALFERAVGFYASLVNINAYHQPGVESGKKASAQVLELQRKVVSFLESNRGREFTASQIAMEIDSDSDVENVLKICNRLCSNKPRGISKSGSQDPFDAKYSLSG